MVLAESVSMAMLVVLETLTPDERAVFVLREVFGFSHDEIASAVGKSSGRGAADGAPRPRARARRGVNGSSPSTRSSPSEITTQFLTAAATGDVEGLMAMLAPDVVFTSDSDGKVSAARRPVLGPAKVARLIVGLMRQAGAASTASRWRPTTARRRWWCTEDDVPVSVITVEIIDGMITNFYAMRNPEKLASATVRREISR